MKALTNRQTKDYIVQEIRDQILSGTIEPGEELAQEALAEMLGISRMPVREALQTLVEEGFAVRLPNRHIQAVVLDAEQIREMFRVTAASEAEMLIAAAEKEIDTGILRKTVEEMKTAEELPEKAQLELEFHRQTAEILQNPYLKQTQRKIIDGYVAYAVENMGEKEKMHQILSGLMDAVDRKDAEGIRESLRAYYDQYADAFAAR